MSYRSLLVLLDQDPLCPRRVATAVRLAGELDSHLVGVAPTDLVDLPLSPKAAASLAAYASVAWDTLRDQARQAARLFSEQCGAAGLKSFEALVDEADRVSSIVRHAHCSDLVILSQADPGDPNHHGTRDMLERTLIQCARPTLVLPYAGLPVTLGHRPMVAWDDSPEVARAVSDALPLLRRAPVVELVYWEEGGVNDDPTVGARMEAVQRWLMWHGVCAEVRSERTGFRWPRPCSPAPRTWVRT